MARGLDQSALVMFARELQAARGKAGLSRELLATKINYSASLIGSAAGGQIAEDHSVVAGVLLTFDTLRSEALPRATSRDLIMKAAEERWT